ncbi:MAG: monovalent cation:proton antiporter-2 (CPA2) family protein [Alphaproteobacteria bacterium]|nr:monovalent cation:proton antiporter-2 (CPA2) family protein [Alphaproteobacteria bacterium]
MSTETAAHSSFQFELADVLIFLLAAVIIVPLFRRLKISPILGYLVAGAFLGPAGFKFIAETDGAHLIAEYGIVFLLFTIGLELSFERLKSLRLYVFGLGSAQFLITSLCIGVIAYFAGLSISGSIILGGALALSSTAFVLRLMADRGEMSTRFGRASFSVLLFQDLAVVPLLAIVPLLGAETQDIGSALGLALLKAVFALVIIILAGRLLLRPIYRVVTSSKSPEAFVAVTLLVILGTAWATYKAGLSMPLGAFLAGLLIAETEYRHQVEADIMPFKGILLGLFFMSIGMRFDIVLAINEFDKILMLVFGLLSLKAIILFGLATVFKFELGPSIRLGILLSQGGEFAFVLLNEVSASVIPHEVSQLMYITVTLSMTMTPLLVTLFWPVCAKLEKKQNTRLEWLEEETEDLENHVIIAGYGRVGETVAKILTDQSIPFVAVDIDASRVAVGRSKAMPVYYGDSCFGEVLRAVGASRARAIVITIGDKKLATRAVMNIRYDFPQTPLFVRARDGQHVRELQKIGVTSTFPETLEASLQLGGAVLKTYGVEPTEVDLIITQFRRNSFMSEELTEEAE